MAAYIALETAMRAGDVAASRAALGDDPSFPNLCDPYTDTPLLALALHRAPTETVAELLRLGADPNFEALDGFPALVLLAHHGREGRHELMRLLIEAGADLDAHGFNDWTPLHTAVNANDAEAVAVLLAAGADPSVRTRIDDLETPLEQAVTAGYSGCVEVLRGHG